MYSRKFYISFHLKQSCTLKAGRDGLAALLVSSLECGCGTVDAVTIDPAACVCGARQSLASIAVLEAAADLYSGRLLNSVPCKAPATTAVANACNMSLPLYLRAIQMAAVLTGPKSQQVPPVNGVCLQAES